MKLTKISTLLGRALRQHKVPGASLAILQDGQITMTAVAGVCNLDTGVKVTDDSVFQIGSITKPHTATLVMQLVDEGLMSLDEPVRTYLPEFRVADLTVTSTVTARHFLSHQSGIDGDFFVDSGRGDDSIKRLIDMATMVPSLFAPTEKLSYCNLGFAVLGRVIEKLTMRSWDMALQERIFDPLGMQHAFSQPEQAIRFRCAVGHVEGATRKDKWKVTRIPYLSYGQKAAGSTPSMTASDLLRFAQMHLAKGKNEQGKRVLSAASVREMQRRQIKAPAFTPHCITGWGLGWMLMDWGGHKMFGHDGGTIGQTSYLRILPEKNLAVALLTNGGDGASLYETMFSAIFEELAGIRVPAPATPDPKVQSDTTRFTGDYQNLNQTIQIRAGKRGLLITTIPNGGGKPPFPADSRLVAIDSNNFRLATGNRMLDRTSVQFSGETATSTPQHVTLGLRQYRRIA